MSKATDLANKIIHAAVYDVALRGAKLAAYAEAPWLKAPIISQIFEYLLGKFADWVYTSLDNAVAFSIIDIETQAQREAYEDAVHELKATLQPLTGAPDAEAIAKAEEEFRKRLSDLIRMHP